MPLFGMLPRDCKKYKVYLDFIAREFARFAPGTTEGIRVEMPGTGAIEHKYVMLIGSVNDLRGMPKGNMQTQAPAIVGACSDCGIHGVNVDILGTTIYPGVGRLLPRDHKLRQEYERVMGRTDLPEGVYKGGPHRPVTDDFVRAAMQAGDACPHKVTCFNIVPPTPILVVTRHFCVPRRRATDTASSCSVISGAALSLSTSLTSSRE